MLSWPIVAACGGGHRGELDGERVKDVAAPGGVPVGQLWSALAMPGG